MNDIKLEKYRKKMWFLLSIGFLLAFFHRYSIGVLSNLLSEEMGLTAANLGLLTSMYFYAYAFLQVPVGVLGDKYGVKVVTTSGMLFMGLGAFMFGLAGSMLTVSLARLLIGIGSACFFISILKMIAIWFPPGQFTKYNGWTSVMGNIGALLAASPFSLFLEIIDWRSAFFIFSGLSLILAFFIWKFVYDYPRDLGFEVENKFEAETRSFKEILNEMKVLVTNLQFWLYFILLFVMMGSIMSLAGLWIVPFMMHVYNLSRSIAANFSLVLTIGLITTSVFLGWIESKFKNRIKMIRFSIFTVSLAWFYLIFIQSGKPSIVQLVVLLFIIGGVSLFVMVTFGVIKELFPQLKGGSMGLINLAPFLGTIFFNSIIGWILDNTWQGEIINGSRIYTLTGYRQGFMVILALMLVVIVLSFKLKKPKN
ncbi:MAG: MFS transporter [Bacillota bacterium]